MAGKPFALIGVNINGYKCDELKKAMNKENLTWRSFADPRPAKDGAITGPIADRWNLVGTPTLYLLDHQGVIRRRWMGGPGDQALDAAIGRLVKQAEKAGKEEPK